MAIWGGWLANLGYLPIVDHVTVTVDAAPDPGSRLADHVSRRSSRTDRLPPGGCCNAGGGIPGSSH
ncbi:hypothetical protein ACWD69_22415 [Micromonospora chokoriensis]